VQTPGLCQLAAVSAFVSGSVRVLWFPFLPEVIVLAVRSYLRFGLSYRDVEELLADRGLEVDHVTVYRRRDTETAPPLPRPDDLDDHGQAG